MLLQSHLDLRYTVSVEEDRSNVVPHSFFAAQCSSSSTASYSPCSAQFRRHKPAFPEEGDRMNDGWLVEMDCLTRLLQPAEKRKASAVEGLVMENEKAKEKKGRVKHWVGRILFGECCD